MQGDQSFKEQEIQYYEPKENMLFFTGLAIISGLIAFGIVKYKTELTDPTDQLSQTPPRVPPALQLAAGSGKVVQKLDAGSYTYIRLDDGTGNETWAAVPKTQLEIGEQIALKGGTVMRNFNSKTMNRTFDSSIVSTGVIRAAGDKNAQTQAATMAGSDVTRSGIAAHGLTPQTRGSSSHNQGYCLRS